MTGERPVRALIVEDEAVVLLELSLLLEDFGFAIAGMASDLDRGVRLAQTLAFDVAVLDVNLAGHDSGPIADALDARGIPFVFASGYTTAALPSRHGHRPLVAKPYSPETLRSALERARGESVNVPRSSTQ